MSSSFSLALLCRACCAKLLVPSRMARDSYACNKPVKLLSTRLTVADCGCSTVVTVCTTATSVIMLMIVIWLVEAFFADLYGCACDNISTPPQRPCLKQGECEAPELCKTASHAMYTVEDVLRHLQQLCVIFQHIFSLCSLMRQSYNVFHILQNEIQLHYCVIDQQTIAVLHGEKCTNPPARSSPGCNGLSSALESSHDFQSKASTQCTAHRSSVCKSCQNGTGRGLQ